MKKGQQHRSRYSERKKRLREKIVIKIKRVNTVKKIRSRKKWRETGTWKLQRTKKFKLRKGKRYYIRVYRRCTVSIRKLNKSLLTNIFFSLRFLVRSFSIPRILYIFFPFQHFRSVKLSVN